MNKIQNITLPRPNSWYYENGYLKIDLELFGKYLCELFNKFLDEYYYFKTFTPTIKTDSNRPIWLQGEERRNLAIITPNVYEEGSWKNYNRVRVVDMSDLRPSYIRSFTTYYNEVPSLFSRAPLKLNEKEFLLYFGKFACDNFKISLGHIENGEFIPTDYFKRNFTGEINHSNLLYPFVEDFIRAIVNYQILNKKPCLEESDMQLILEEFGISRKEKLQTLIELLKNVQEEATETLLSNNKVGKVLVLSKDNKSIK